MAEPMDEPRKLSSEEQREQMKEQFKKDLKERQAFLEKMKHLRSQQNILKALEGMTPEDDTDEWVRKLNEESAFVEAKTEIALDTQAMNVPEVPVEQKPSEEELRKIVAEQMVKELKKQMDAGQKGQFPETLDELSNPPEDQSHERPIRKMIDGLE